MLLRQVGICAKLSGSLQYYLVCSLSRSHDTHGMYRGFDTLYSHPLAQNVNYYITKILLQAFDTRCLYPLGGSELTSGYKGYGLGAMVELFCGILGGNVKSSDGFKIRIVTTMEYPLLLLFLFIARYALTTKPLY